MSFLHSRRPAHTFAALLLLTATACGTDPEALVPAPGVDGPADEPADDVVATPEPETLPVAADRPELPDGWVWLEVPGAAVGVPATWAGSADPEEFAFPEVTAAASEPDAFYYQVTVGPLTVFDPLMEDEVAVSTIAAFREYITGLLNGDAELREINGGTVDFTVAGKTGDLDIIETQIAYSTSGDVGRVEYLVEVPRSGVIRFSREIYFEDAAALFDAGEDTIDILPTIWVDPAGWQSPETTAGPFVHALGADFPLSIRGIGVIEAGMTIDQARAITGQTWEVSGFEDFGTCGFARVVGIDSYSFMVFLENEGDWEGSATIGRVSTYGGEAGSQTVATLSGIAPGSTVEDVRAAYGDALVESPHAYTNGLYLDLFGTDGDTGFGVRFETGGDGIVEGIHAGDADAIQAIEGCA